LARRSSKSDAPTLFSSNAPASRGGSVAEPPGGDVGDAGGGTGDGDAGVALHEAAQQRYLNYSLSVITSRALPDVRDGLKPVQRRILYTMYRERMLPDAKPRKCAGVVGTALKDFHPHGDAPLYEALARLAQPWVMRHVLVDGHGNFGSVDGDAAAAYRYTECRLGALAWPLLDDLRNDTVPFRANYDNTTTEPVVLPARYPHLLVNGGSGIAVGMATNIPPHNLGEVLRACLKLLAEPEIQDYRLVANDAVQGPDFPTGGQVVTSRDELREIYKTGSGTIRVRATLAKETKTSRSAKTLVVNSLPYSVNKAALVEQVAQIVLDRQMPLLLDVRDLSTDDVRIELDLKPDADEAKVLAYLYKHTQLQVSYGYNLTCLVPTENPEVGAPSRLGLKEILWHFLHFRLDVVTRRLTNELNGLQRRIHILTGFALVFDALDEVIRIIRGSDGKADAAAKLMRRFKALDEEQTDAILELKLYRLAKLEINLVDDELKEKSKRAREIKKLLADDSSDTSTSGRWGIVRKELEELLESEGKSAAAKRRTVIEAPEEEVAYAEEDFIVEEDCAVLVTADGWVKRQREIKEPAKTRLREGDSVLACVAGSTRATLGFFSSNGTCYTARFVDVPASTGHGEPIQKLFKMKDGERIVAVIGFDPRTLGGSIAEDPKKPEQPPAVHAFAATSDGYALRFALDKFVEPSTRAGRRYARPADGHAVVGVFAIGGKETILAISADCHAMVCPAKEVNYLAGPGKGVLLIKLGADDRLLGFKPSTDDRDLMLVETNRGAQKTISTAKYRVTARGGRGTEIQKNGKIARVVPEPVEAPTLE